jgi:uncharacterized membrane protein
VVTTSPRRLQQGLLYSIFVSFLTYYLLAYAVNRLASRRVFGMPPAFRGQTSAAVKDSGCPAYLRENHG